MMMTECAITEFSEMNAPSAPQQRLIASPHISTDPPKGPHSPTVGLAQNIQTRIEGETSPTVGLAQNFQTRIEGEAGGSGRWTNLEAG